MTADLRAGTGELLVPVGLPLFVEATIADSYLASDRPSIQLRAYGEALRAGDPVTFTVESTALRMASTSVTGTAFEPVTVPLPALAVGRPAVTISATSTTRNDAAGKPLTDRLVRSFDIVASRLTAAGAAYGVAGGDALSVPAAAGPAGYTFTDAGRGRFLQLLLGLAEPSGARLDRGVAHLLARQLLVSEFGYDEASLPPSAFDPSRYPAGVSDDGNGRGTAGAALLPYGGLDPWLGSRIAVLAPDVPPSSGMRDALVWIRDQPTTRRDLGIAALAGLAALGEPVMADLLEARGLPDLSTTERLHLALGFEALGDDAAALGIERALLAADGERLGPWVRLGVGEDVAATVAATALLAVVAAGVGDPLAAGMAEYVEANPNNEATYDLELAAWAARSLERTPAAAASFAYTVDGDRRIVNLDPGEAFTVTLTADQRAGLGVETLSGQVGVAAAWRAPVDPASLRAGPDPTLTRKVPVSPIPADRIVTVELTAEFGAQAPDGCYEVTELVPSGLAPLQLNLYGNESGALWPDSVIGQEVRFCAVNAERSRTVRMRYTARIVNAGTFAWEPAIMQLAGAPELLARTPAETTTIQAR